MGDVASLWRARRARRRAWRDGEKRRELSQNLARQRERAEVCVVIRENDRSRPHGALAERPREGRIWASSKPCAGHADNIAGAQQSVLTQERRRGDENMPIRGEAPPDVIGANEIADANRNVDAVSGQVYPPLRGEDVDVHRWVSPTKVGQKRPPRLEGRRQRNSKPASLCFAARTETGAFIAICSPPTGRRDLEFSLGGSPAALLSPSRRFELRASEGACKSLLTSRGSAEALHHRRAPTFERSHRRCSWGR